MRQIHGITLIELMIVVAIIGILAAVGYPSYLEHARETRRSDAIVALNRISLEMEACRADNATFTGCAPTTATEQGYYQNTITVTGGGAGYTLTATPVVGEPQESDTECTTLTLASTGVKGYSGSASDASECWGN